ncbi:uncharacterized protein LOC124950564 [Vespa velutina]|uniref:uncharacterized protein LOC124950564 n=1 Tax=Vespa velutina TaxID=202808 RepID=UPI001FB4A824|nr:uncharacterized protein LOC124950564 [Vespa velutina]XP_047353402.1 uncharacterized protein LOC124950564 [Vespa velutina]XP_047353403.1 uncharacterized protein LOC124950564 [Vespa velutina]XP_047353404.1 uncharacterized protein LOC124950564 [Vespa velutina]XP_047353405.1 uncharacterized protein LOC124950564 [Vespa velutina]
MPSCLIKEHTIYESFSKMNVIFLLVFLIIQLTTADYISTGFDKGKTSKMKNPFYGHSKPRFISFDSEEGNIDISWDVSIPFISIPLLYKNEENEHSPTLLNVNTKALTIAGLVTGISSLVAPLFSKPITSSSQSHYRTDEGMEWSTMGNTINEIIFSNNYIAPCMQHIVCSIVSAASRADNPTSTEKIIDGLSSHRWFKDATNGTLIQDAISIGRDDNRDCTRVYKNCLITPRLFKSFMNQFGIM